MAQNIRHAVESFQQAVAEKAAFNTKIAAARQQMTAACNSSRLLRDHPAQIPEATNFVSLLDAKDIYFLSLTYDPIGFGPQYQAFNEMIEKSTGFGRKLDDGIRPLAIFPWSDWIDSMNRQAKRNSSTSLSGLLANYSALFTFSKTNGYLRYRLARNIVELNACGCNLSNSAEELWSALLIVRQPWYGALGGELDPTATARQYYDKLNEVYGAESVQRAAKSLLEARKDSDGAILSPTGEKEGSFTAIGRSLAETSSKNYLLNVLLPWGSPFRPDQLADAALQYRELVAAYGSSAVNQAAQSLGKAKLDTFGRIADPRALGIHGGVLKSALFDLLAVQHPAAYPRAMLAFHDRLTGTSAIDSAYQKLTTTYKPADVLAASQDLLKLWQAPVTLLPRRYVSVVQERFTREKDPGFDFTLLLKFLNKTESLPKLAGPSPEIVSDPRYLAWAKFKPGDNAVYAFKSWMEKDGEVVAPRRPQPVDAPYQGILEVALLKSIDAETAVVESIDKNLLGAGKAKPIDYAYPARINQEQLHSPDQPTLVSRTSGTDSLQINGHTYSCVWQKVAYRFPTGSQVVTTWTSDAIPGGLALEREEQSSFDGDGVGVHEKVLQPFPISDPAMLRTGLPVAFAVTSAQNPASSQETAKLAERSSADLVKTPDGKLPPIPPGTLIDHR